MAVKKGALRRDSFFGEPPIRVHTVPLDWLDISVLFGRIPVPRRSVAVSEAGKPCHLSPIDDHFDDDILSIDLVEEHT
jgi:hypothetical protein